MKQIKRMVLVLAGGSYIYDRQEISCRETWANPRFYDEDTKVYFVRMNVDPKMYERKPERNLNDVMWVKSDEFKSISKNVNIDEAINYGVTIDHDTRTVFVDGPDGYFMLMIKSMLAIRELRKVYKWDYLTRSITANYINLNLLAGDLDRVFGPAENNTRGVYACINREPPGHGLIYPSGACFTLSSSLTDDLIECLPDMIRFQKEDPEGRGLWDDMTYGMFLGQLGATYRDAPRIGINPNDPTTINSSQTWFKPNCYHYLFSDLFGPENVRIHYQVHKLFYPNEKCV